MPDIHVTELSAGPVALVYVWLDNHDDDVANGALIGVGNTRREALDVAIEELQAHLVHLDTLRAGTPA